MVLGFFGWLVVLVLVFLWMAINIVNEYQRVVVFRLGRLVAARGPGLVLIIPLIERAVRMDLRVVTLDVPPQDVITRDNVSVKVNAVVYFRVIDPNKALVNVENFMFATSQLSQTTLRSVCGQAELDELLAERERINEKIQTILDADTDPWGIKVTKVEVKQVDIPETMQRAIARQAEAERERRAKVIHADGEFQASQKLADAAKILETQPAAIQLRYLQTLTEIGVEKNTTIVFPLPVDIINVLVKSLTVERGASRTNPPS
jgi:regulator of protease activity HflC (stomatin/prohibitin superfamily)